jgi:nucleoside-diphosphate-sugar epimerase
MQRLLIVGCGDIALRSARQLTRRYRVFGLARSRERAELLRRAGIVPLTGDLDRPNSLRRLAGVADVILHLAPPAPIGETDARTAHLVAALSSRGSLPQRLIYMSTSGVYGNCAGDWVPETRPVAPATARAKRRVDAENRLRRWGARSGVAVSILRVPGIYAPERLPLARLREGVPALISEQDAFSNHIHADDLVQCVLAALTRGRPGRVYHAADGTPLKMGDYFDIVADAFQLPRPPRVTLAEAQTRLSPIALSFMCESRKLENQRLRRELKVVLRYPNVMDGIAAAASAVRVPRQNRLGSPVFSRVELK